MAIHSCDNCGHYYMTTPSGGVEAGSCPNCGHPYAGHLPTPIHDEMTHGLDAMPTSTQDDMSGNPLQEGTLGYGDGGWQGRMKRDESYASVRSYAQERYAYGDNDHEDFSLGGQLPANGQDYDVRVPTHAFLVSPSGQIHAMQEDPNNQTTHEQIAQALGHSDSILGQSAQGRLYSNGQTSWHGNPTQLSPGALGKLLSDHFGRPVAVDPNDPGVSGPSQDAFERMAADFEAEDMDVIPPGGQSLEVTPHPNGLSGAIHPLKSIQGLLVNGRPIDNSYAQELGSWDPSQNVVLSHDDPQLLDVAKQVVENGNSGPLIQHAQGTQAAHRGQVQLPHGLTNNVHLALGNLGAWVANPQEANELRPWKNNAYRQLIRDYHDQTRPPVTQIGVRDPAMLKVIQDVANTDDLQPLYAHHGVPRQSALHRSYGEVGDPDYQPDPAPQQPQGGGGGGGGLLGSGAGSLMGRALGPGVSGLMGGGGGAAAGEGAAAGGAAAGEAGALAELAPLALLASVHEMLTASDKIDHPNTQDSVGEDDDPEKVDQKEVNDGDMTSGQDAKMGDQDGGGGGDSPFGEDSQGVKALEGALPIVIEYAMSDKPGKGHPLLEAIHQMLDSEVPGYLNHTNDEAADQIIKQHGKTSAYPGDITAPTLTGQPTFPTTTPTTPNPGSVPNPQQQTPMPTPGNHGKCPICGSTYDPSHPTCPQCGAGTIASPGQPVEQDIGGMQVGAAVGDHSFMYEPSLTDIPEGVTLDQFRQNQPARPNMVAGPCPNCNSATDLTKPFCKHCLQDLPQHMAKTAETHQGPHTPEQQQAVSQLLIDQGRQDEIPVMLDPMTAYQYADELASIQGQEAPPQGESQDPAPPPGEQPQPGMMPVPPMSAPPMGMQSALDRYAADNVAPMCPACGSHTTAMATKDGTCRCHACGNTWKADIDALDGPDTTKESRWQVVAIDHHQDLNVNPSDAPAADAEKPFDPEMDQDPSHTWQDFNGMPLTVGQQYKVHSQKYSIPDVVQIVAVKPDSIVVQETGAYGLGYSREIKHEEAQLDGLEFEPVGDFSDADPSQPEQPEAPDLEVGPGDQTDMSQREGPRSSKTAELHGWDKPPIEKQCPVCGGAANMHDPQCPLNEEIAKQQVQKGLEQAWRLPTVDHPLGPTAKVASEFGYTCPQCQHSDDTRGGPLPSACPNCGITGYTMWNDDPELQHYLHGPNPEEAETEAMMGGQPHDPQGQMQQSYLEQMFQNPSVQHPLGPHAGRTAGAKFTPMEQREFIDEQGNARNSDKLDLSNTHYESSFEEDDFDATSLFW